jgi:hypothetical protein
MLILAESGEQVKKRASAVVGQFKSGTGGNSSGAAAFGKGRFPGGICLLRSRTRCVTAWRLDWTCRAKLDRGSSTQALAVAIEPDGWDPINSSIATRDRRIRSVMLGRLAAGRGSNGLLVGAITPLFKPKRGLGKAPRENHIQREHDDQDRCNDVHNVRYDTQRMCLVTTQ